VTPSREAPFFGAHLANKGYPDGHADNPVDENIEIDRLKAKVDAGADFVITQLFYDVDHFLSWYKKIRQKGLLLISYLFFFFLWLTFLTASTRHHRASDPGNYANSDILIFRKSNKIVWNPSS